MSDSSRSPYAPLGRLRPAGFAPGLLVGIDAGLAVRVGERPDSIAAWRPLLVHGEPTTWGDAATEIVRKPRRPPAVAANPARFGKRRQALWSGIAAAVIVVVGAGYVMFGSDRPLFGGKAVQSLTAEELEQALVERRKADVAAVEKKRLEQEAQRQADADAKAKEAAEADLAKAREQRQKAEAELAKLKADMEARRQAEAAQRDQAATAARRALEERPNSATRRRPSWRHYARRTRRRSSRPPRRPPPASRPTKPHNARRRPKRLHRARQR